MTRTRRDGRPAGRPVGDTVRLLIALIAVATVFTVGACSGEAQNTSARRSSSAPTTAAVTSPPASTAPASTAPATTTTAVPVFESAISEIDDAIGARMASSWRPGCPVPLAELRLLTLGYWGYDGAAHRGELVVHADQAERIVEVFRALFDTRFPIERMELVDVYGGDDHASTLANNTAGFNCRAVVGNPGSWSQHAFGRAIDVNPRVNPYLLDPRLSHPELAPYVNRALDTPGMIRAGDDAVRAFAAHGWQWGGVWSPPDYQHFSATGR